MMPGGSHRRERSPLAVLEEIESIHATGIRDFYINDDIYFTGSPTSKARVDEIAWEIRRRNLGIWYKTQLRADSIAPGDLALLQRLHDSGLTSVFLGLESGSDEMLAFLGKRSTVDCNAQAVQMLRSVGIRVNAGRILFGPDTTWGELTDSVSGMHTLGVAWQVFRYPMAHLRVFPGTRVAKDLDAAGRLTWRTGYLEPSYPFMNPGVGDFCRAIEQSYGIIRSLMANLTQGRSFGGVDPHIEYELESASYDFLMESIALGDSWVHTFPVNLDTFLGKLEALQSGRIVT